jgi:integrase/recombinase XerD
MYQNIVKRYTNELGLTEVIPGFCVHSLCAAAATKALKHKTDIAKVQVWLGHAAISTTRISDQRQNRLEDSPTFTIRHDMDGRPKPLR